DRPPRGRAPRHRCRRGHRVPLEPAARAVLRARHHRVLAGAAARGQPLARIHLGLGGHPRSLPSRPGFWTLGIADKRVWVYLVLGLAVLLYAIQRYLELSRRGYQLAAVRE